MTAKAYKKEVRNQYEQYPYPYRAPEDEKKVMHRPFPDMLGFLNHYGFEGKQDFKGGFRALIAGGGTGDSAIFMGEQLSDRGGEVVYLDISEASKKICEERAAIRGLSNITFHHASILDLPALGLGEFDYINCSGVLHHLPSPEDGLAAVASVLKEDGIMGVMVYGQYGRTGLYHFQELMQLMCEPLDDMEQRVNLCKTVLQSLPASNWLNWNNTTMKDTIRTNGDIGIYDLFLHSQDRAYTVEQLYDWTEGAGLILTDIVHHQGKARSMFNPFSYITDPVLREHFKTLESRDRQSIAELLCGTVNKHNFYAAKKAKHTPTAQDPEMVPFFKMQFGDKPAHEMLFTLLNEQEGDIRMVHDSRNDVTVLVTILPHTLSLLEEIDGNTSCGDIIDRLIQKKRLEKSDAVRAEVSEQLVRLCKELHNFDWLLMRHQSIDAFPHVDSYQQNMLKRMGYATKAA